MNGTGNICSIGFRDDHSPSYWPHLNAHGRGDISLGRQIASPLDSMRSPPAALSPISSRVFPITGARVSSLYRDRCQPPPSPLWSSHGSTCTWRARSACAYVYV